MKQLLLSLAVLVSASSFSVAQTEAVSPAETVPVATRADDKPLKFNLNEDGSHYFQATFLNQTWLRYDQSNPGTTVLGQPANNTFDIGLRRTRIQMFGQITDRAFLYFQFGMNNFNFNYNNGANPQNRKVQAFFHDALGEYRLSKGNELKVGAGLTATNGLSRFTQPSIGTILALDVPVWAQATVDQIDLFDRKLSLYARGQIGKFDYRAIISDPFPISTAVVSNPAPIAIATFANYGHHKQYQGYLMYQFWEKEANTMPYMAGTYLGKKKVLNLAGGFIRQKNAMWSASPTGTQFHNMRLWNVEGFLDTPINTTKGTALTAYLGYYSYDFGPNYIRVLQQMNPADANSIDAGVSNLSSKGGNGIPMMGTGQIVYGQLGYLLANNLLGEDRGQLQPYVTYYHGRFELLNDPTNVYNIGFNYLLTGHRSKVSLDYQNRPYYNTAEKVAGRRGSITLQYQLFLQ
ncbi:hypothetical protein [Adhaeribacter aquaticus]|uniref:hypothetical protein n=1 Tax=Adhaeribacter aquaticus TaxID=299567 RepID=UPI00040FF58D|nr:hypothetical protein [Adhaeribacter aquaticus]